MATLPKHKLSDLLKAAEIAKSRGDATSMASIKRIYQSNDFINDVDDVQGKGKHASRPKKEIVVETKTTPIPVIETKLVETEQIDPLAINLDLFKPSI